LDKDIVSQCVEVGRKKGELRELLKFLRNDKHADDTD